ncbi:HEPN domain-containing protein [candidate division WOR-3 bacterium]|nr:HEPN domain-containing protein [candidate division WOR-3 bacterium]
MTNTTLAQSLLIKAIKRIKVLKVLFEDSAYSDVIRESQELVELACKAILRQIGIEPPKWHDVGKLIIEYKERLPKEAKKDVKKIAEISHWLRKERELSFYGDIDFIPTEEYTREDAKKAMSDARFVVKVAKKVIPTSST